MVDAFKQFVIDEPKIYDKYPSIYNNSPLKNQHNG